MLFPKPGNSFPFLGAHQEYNKKLHSGAQKKSLQRNFIPLCDHTKSLEYGSPNIPEIAWE